MGSWIRTGEARWVGIACFPTSSEDIRLMVAPQSTSEEGMAVFSIIVASLMVGTEERGYSESGSDSTMTPNALTDSFFTSFALLTDSNLSGQSAAVWPTLILRHQKQPLL